jgi:hypothetical protein
MSNVLGVSEELNNELQLHDSIESAAQADVHKEDFSQYTKAGLLNHLVKLNPEDNIQEVASLLKSIRTQYDHLFEQEQQQALQKFLEDGSAAEDFQYKKDEASQSFDAEYQKIKDKVSAYYSGLEKQKTKNLEIKKNVLEQMRAIISSEESAESLQEFKKLQEDWRNTGPVPSTEVKELWANYQALTDMFYNNRSVYFELKELDRRKNLSLKNEIISKIQQLIDHSQIQHAFTEMRKLQEEFRHIGPVPKEEHESIWSRLKVASDAIHGKRQHFYEEFSKKKEENYTKKLELIEKLKGYEEFTSDKIDDWKEKSDEVLHIQEEWKKIGQVPEDKLKELSRNFWAAGKKFFANKNAFFKKLDNKRKENLVRKTELCEKAEALKDSQDFAATSKALIQLQKEWTKIGQVPIKYKDSIYERFKKACDAFFQQQRDLQTASDAKLVDNLKQKESLLTELEAKLKGAFAETKETILSYLHTWEEIGFVPIEQKKTMQEKFKQVLDSMIDKLPVSGEDKEKLHLNIEVKQGGAKKVENLMRDLQKKAATIKADIDQYKNNMDFFAKSTKASALKDEVLKKIADAEVELKKLNDKLRILKG